VAVAVAVAEAEPDAGKASAPVERLPGEIASVRRQAI
jgi:hypothetical protein